MPQSEFASASFAHQHQICFHTASAMRVPTKLGFKNPKHIAAGFVTNTNPGGYWEDQGYNWFSGL